MRAQASARSHILQLSPSLLLLTIAAYIGVLFWVARRGDKQRLDEHSWVRHPAVYGLALGVYCTSWTYYGLVGNAAASNWQFLSILLGPVLMFTLGMPVLERIFTICKQEHIHSVADFLASRYGKRQGIAASVTLVVLLATVPYISLQLKAVSDSLTLMIGSHALGNQDITLFIAGAMVVFALLFGAKQLDVSGYHGGLMGAIAFESVVKLFVLIFVAAFATYWIGDSQQVLNDVARATDNNEPIRIDLRFMVELGLSACALFCLPRMFHVGFVECLSDRHLRAGRIIFPLYLAIIAICISYIADAGNLLFTQGEVSAETYVLAIPLAHSSQWLSVLAFIGGFSAATAMIIVATVTLSQMLSNDVFLPFIMGSNEGARDYSQSLIMARRITIAMVVVFAYLYQAALASNAELTSIGLVAFALSVHLAPAILFGLYSRKVNAKGVYAGLATGLGIWAYMLLLPFLARIGLLDPAALAQGFAGQAWLSPYTLFSFEFSDHFTRSVLISLSGNIGIMWLVSRYTTSSFSDRVQAAAFTKHAQIDPETLILDKLQSSDDEPVLEIPLEDLKELCTQFVGPSNTEKLFEHTQGPMASPDIISSVQRALSGIVGVASSQSIISSLNSGAKLAMEDVVSMFGETTRALRFNQEILFSSFENVSSAISVVNKHLNIVAWNRRYEAMFNYPKGMLKIGVPVSDLVRFNAERGLLGAGAIAELVDKRLKHLQDGKPYRVVRQHHGDHVIEIKGTPLPDGGYVTTYDDITDFISAQRELEQSNQHLEQRVEKRTSEIQAINEDLVKEIELRKSAEHELINAKAQAEAANATKSRFLALASHDILQPINAAQLYLNSLLEHDQERRNQDTLIQVREAVTNAESIISSLLEIARLDTRAMRPELSHFKIDELLSSLVNEFQVQVEAPLSLHYVHCSLAVISDRNYLRRILQNFLSNALKYTQSGKILLGCRRRGNDLEIQVHDTGAGISEEEQKKIFTDFYRSNQQSSIKGLGLGLAVTERLADILKHPLKVRSRPLHGSCFSITVPLGSAPVIKHQNPHEHADGDLKGLNIVYVDDGEDNLKATELLLNKWGCEMQGFMLPELALQACKNQAAPDVLLMDYQLNSDDYNGITLAKAMREQWQKDVPVCIISAAADPELPSNAKGQGFNFLHKPLKPAKLRAWLNHLASRQKQLAIANSMAQNVD